MAMEWPTLTAPSQYFTSTVACSCPGLCVSADAPGACLQAYAGIEASCGPTGRQHRAMGGTRSYGLTIVNIRETTSFDVVFE